jgi:ribosomal protein L19E
MRVKVDGKRSRKRRKKGRKKGEKGERSDGKKDRHYAFIRSLRLYLNATKIQREKG